MINKIFKILKSQFKNNNGSWEKDTGFHSSMRPFSISLLLELLFYKVSQKIKINKIKN